LRPEDLIRMPDEQFEITRSATRLLKPGGVLVYSTCSIEPEENGQLVERLLNHFPQMRLGDETSSLPFRDHFDGAFAARLINTA
jgi:16S rRNA (cytosine967-C5)-methyltransferase